MGRGRGLSTETLMSNRDSTFFRRFWPAAFRTSVPGDYAKQARDANFRRHRPIAGPASQALLSTGGHTPHSVRVAADAAHRVRRGVQGGRQLFNLKPA